MELRVPLKRAKIPGRGKLRKGDMMKVLKAMQVSTGKPVDALKLLGRR